MKITCPECGSTEVRQLIADSDNFICKSCGEVFDADTDELPEEDNEEEDEE